jgi:SAM-dependent methyltransferase
MNVLEYILKSLSRQVGDSDCSSEAYEVTIENSLALLQEEYADFGALVAGKRIADFGCGLGYQSIALVQQHGCSVVGIDSNRDILEAAVANAKTCGIPASQLAFVDRISEEMLGTFDVVVSQNSFEHFGSPEAVLGEMRRLSRKTGTLLISFGPPWYAPYGSHMHFFCKVPWINVLFPEKTVMKVRQAYRDDGAKRYEDVESGLNRMSVAKFERIIKASGLRIEFKNYRCIKRMDFLARIPLLREFFINHISVILSLVSQGAHREAVCAQGSAESGRQAEE